jgi:ABC-type nitrate/sulfonate/bicarbonate transport system substrate-binding protein
MRLRQLAILLTILVFSLAACSSGGDASQTAQESEAAASEPAEGSAAPPESTEPERSGSARIGIGGWSIAYVPTAIVIDRMNEMGYDIEAIETSGTSAQMQAATQGELDITSVSAAATMTAIDAGLDSKFFLTRNLNEFVLVAKSEFDSCESLDGQRVAIHAQTDITGLLTTQWFESNCPDAAPNIQIVEGSENRLAGLLQDQLDASPVDIGDSIQLERERPGEFTVLANFVDEFPVLQGVYAASPSWMAENEQLVKDFIQLHLDVWEEFYADPSSILPKAEELLPEIDPEVLQLLAEEYAAQEIFPANGDLEEEETQYTIDFFAEAGAFANVGGFEDIADRSYLDAVLDEQ